MKMSFIINATGWMLALAMPTQVFAVWNDPYDFPATRDPLAWPFATNSIWNTPIGSDARYVSYQGQYALGVNHTYCDDDIVVLTPTAPLMDVYQNNEGWSWGDHMRKDGGLLFSAPIPQSFYFSRHGNACLAVLMPDSHTIKYLQ